MAFTAFIKFIQTLKPALLEQGKCTKSFYWQIFQNKEGASDKAELRQKKQFNLGSSFKLSIPLEAANYLLGQDYKETFLFHASAKVQNSIYSFPMNLYQNSAIKRYPIWVTTLKNIFEKLKKIVYKINQMTGLQKS